MERSFAIIQSVRLISKHARHGRVAWPYLLLVSCAVFFLHPEFSIVGIVDQGRIVAPDRVMTRGDDSLGGKRTGLGNLSLNRGAAGLSFGLSQSLLRFDFKQNLRIWPVLATGIERSPPAA
jgi:hypothetical protein